MPVIRLSAAISLIIGICFICFLIFKFIKTIIRLSSISVQEIQEKWVSIKYILLQTKMTKSVLLMMASTLMVIGAVIDSMTTSNGLEAPFPFILHPEDPTHIMSPYHFTVPRSGLNPPPSSYRELILNELNTPQIMRVFGVMIVIAKDKNGGFRKKIHYGISKGTNRWIFKWIKTYRKKGSHKKYFRCSKGQIWIKHIGAWPRCVDIHVD